MENSNVCTSVNEHGVRCSRPELVDFQAHIHHWSGDSETWFDKAATQLARNKAAAHIMRRHRPAV